MLGLRSSTCIVFVLLLASLPSMAEQENSEEIVPPIPLAGNPSPEFPQRAQAERVGGNVSYQVLVDKEGRVQEIEIVKVPKEGLGFEEAAEKALRQWHFAPALRNKEPVAQSYEGVFEFTLTYSTDGARMYAVPSSRMWEILKEVLAENRFRYEEMDGANGVIITKWRKVSASRSSVLVLPNLSEYKGAKRFQIHILVPQVSGAARLYINTMIRVSYHYLHYNQGYVERWLYEQVEERLGLRGHAIPCDGAKRRILAAKLLGQTADDECTEVRTLLAGTGDISNPILVPSTKVEPIYSASLHLARKTGSLILLAVINEDGWVADIELLRSPDPETDFYTAGAQPVSFWRFRPAMKKDCPVAVYFSIIVNFHLY